MRPIVPCGPLGAALASFRFLKRRSSPCPVVAPERPEKKAFPNGGQTFNGVAVPCAPDARLLAQLPHREGCLRRPGSQKGRSEKQPRRVVTTALLVAALGSLQLGDDLFGDVGDAALVGVEEQPRGPGDVEI